MAKKEPKLSYDEVLLNLKQGKFAPVYFLTGTEPYFIDSLADFIAGNALNESEQEFNQSVLYGKDVDVPSLLANLKRFPMMAEKQVIILKEAQDLKKIEELEGYINAPMSSTIFVCCYKYKKIDGRSSFSKSLKKDTVYFESDKMYDNQLPGWISRFVKNKGYQIGETAVQLLATNIGSDLHALVNALDKLVILAPKQGEITAKLIEENIGISRDFNVFEFQKAIGEKDILKSNRIANHFAQNEKTHPILMTISLLYGFFSKVMMFHYLPDKSKFPASTALQINPFFYNDYLLAARNYPAGKALQIIGHLKDYDLRAKGLGSTGAVTDGELLKELLFKILH